MYINNEQIVTFLNKAQNKIADLSSLIVRREGDKQSLELLLELLNIIETIDNHWLDWSEATILQVIDYYNVKAELNLIPFLEIIGYNTNIIVGGVNGSNITSVDQLNDYVFRTNDLISKTKHNSLKEIQGGKTGEYYHVTKDMYDWILSRMNPFVSPTVKLDVITSPSGTLFEMGSTISNVKLNGTYTLNSGKEFIRSRYIIGNSEVLTVNEGVNKSYTYGSLTGSTVFRYQVDFMEGGTKEAVQQIKFVKPSYYAVAKQDLVPSAISKTKILKDGGERLDITFSAPIGNASKEDGVVFYLFIPQSYGEVKNIYVDMNSAFNYITSFSKRVVTVPLINGVIENYVCYELIDPTEGTFNFNFIF